MISRIFRGDNENAAIKRKRQIDTLKIFNDNVIELREDVEYQVEFNAGDKRMAIIVLLSPDFPLEKPVLKILPFVVHHPWCNDHSEIVNAPGLINFTVHSDLGRVVQAIIREFSKNPPSQFREDTLSAINTTHPNELQDGSFAYGLQCHPQDHYAVSYNSSAFNSQFPKYLSNTNIHKYNYINTCISDDEQAAFASTSHGLMYANNHHQNNSHHNLITNSVTAAIIGTTTTTTVTTTTTTTTTTTITANTTVTTDTTATIIGTIATTTSTITTTTAAAAVATVATATATVTATTPSVTDNHPMQYYVNHQSSSYKNSICCSTKYMQSVMPNQQPIHSNVSLEFPELNGLNIEELMKLFKDEDDNIDTFLDECSRLEDIHCSIDGIIDSVEEMANINLTKEMELKTLQDEIMLKMQTVSALKSHYDNLIQQYNKLSEAFTPDHIRECLKHVADNSHEQSEKISENFLEKKIDVERFLSTYIECRKVGQARRTKEEKLAHQLNELKRAGY